MMKVALVDKFNKKTNYHKYFPEFDFDIYHLSSTNKKKLLKKDIDIDIDIDQYDYIITVGAEPTKYFVPTAAVTSHQGYLVEDKFLPLIDPNMLIFKPEQEGAFVKAVSNIVEYIEGTKAKPISRELVGIENDEEAHLVLSNILELSPRPVALDTETSALYARDGYVLGISICADINTGYYISTDCIYEEHEELLQQIINKHTIVFHNAKFDIAMLSYHFNLDFKIKDVTNPHTFEDTMIMHYCLDESTGTHGLKDLCIKYTDLGDYDRELDTFRREYCRKNRIKFGDFTYDLIPFDIMVPYACCDTIGTLELYNKFKPLIKGKRIEKAYNLIKKGTKFLVQIEDNGVPFSPKRLEKAQEQLSADIFKLEQEIYSYSEISKLESDLGNKFNPNSTQQLQYLFFKVLKLPPTGKKTGTGADSVDAEVLKELAKLHPIVEDIANLRKIKKIKSTYIDKILVGLDRDNRLRTGFNLTTTTSGRLSSSGKLNMQQLPRDNKIVKACIKPVLPDYVIVSQDLATAEMYVAAVLSGDKNLQKVFIDKQAGKGADFHSTIAHMVFRLPCDVSEVKKKFPELRQAAKAISFGILYGSGPQKVADTVNEEGGNFTLEDAKDAISKYFAMFPKLKKWLSDNQEFIKQNGYTYSIFDRKRRLANVFSKDRVTQGHELRSGINFLVQSVASDINLLASIEIQDYINKNNLDVEIFGLVHDSILAVVHKDDLDEYLKIAAELTQKDHGCMIPGCPIAIDQEIGEDYSFKELELFKDAA